MGFNALKKCFTFSLNLIFLGISIFSSSFCSIGSFELDSEDSVNIRQLEFYFQVELNKPNNKKIRSLSDIKSQKGQK